MNPGRWLKRKSIWLYARMIKEKASPEYIARGWAIGMFCGCFIPFGVQLFVSIPSAFLLKGSKIGATLGTLLTNQATIFFIYPVQCYVGNKLIGGDLTYQRIKDALGELLKKQDFSTLFSLGPDLIWSFFAGGFLLAAVTTPITYFGVRSLVKEYQKIKLARKNKS